MIQYLLDGEYRDIELVHVRMSFSKDVDSAGRFKFAKLLELIRVVSSIYRTKFMCRADVLYYPPSGPQPLPLMKDVVVVGLTRWLFKGTVLHFHASGISETLGTMNPLLSRLSRIVFANPDLAIHISKKGPRDGLSFGCKEEKVIANGIPDAAGEFFARSTGLGARIHILLVAALCEEKGVLVAIQAIMELLKQGIEVELTCVGKWQSAEFQARALALVEPPYGSHFNFPGVMTGGDKWQYYRDAHIFMLPSFYHSETFPVVLLEAMCFSLPIVATRWRGIPEVVEEGSCAILCEPRDVAGCREALAQLVNDPSLRHNMGRESRERYLRHFTIESHRRAMECALSHLGDASGTDRGIAEE
ncbi:MAG: glycosyltransferase family 4 protein [Terracidiphilus sp.]